MKKCISLLLAAVVLLSLAACGKSDAVKAVEAMIAGFTDMTSETEEDAAAIQEAYNALSAEEQKKVRGYPEFTEMRDSYYESMLSGVRYAFDLNLHEPESVFSPRCSITLNGDMTATSSCIGPPVSLSDISLKTAPRRPIFLRISFPSAGQRARSTM